MPRTKPTHVKYVKAAKVPAKGAKRPFKKSYGLSAGVRSYAHCAQAPLNDQTVAVTALTVRVALPVLPDGAWGGQVYANMALFPRAAAMAKLFQEYRVTRLDYLLQPNASVYGTTSNTAYAVPGSYFPQATGSACYLQGLKWLNAPKIASDVTDLFMSEVGVTPTLFDKECVITQKPIVNYNVANSVDAAAAPTTALAVKQSPWLATTTAAALADSTTHWGPIVRVVQQPIATTTGIQATPPAQSPGYYQVRCTFEFRKPSMYKAATE